MAEPTSSIAELSAPDPAARRRVAEQLGRDTERARAAAAALVAACEDPDESVRVLVSGVLEDLGPPPEGQLAQLVPLVHHEHADVAYWAVTLIGRLGHRSASAVPALVKTLAEHSAISVRQRAAWALSQIGPTAAAARDPLEAAARSDDPRLARLARAALDQLTAR